MLICNKERSKSLERERVLERKIGWKESCLLNVNLSNIYFVQYFIFYDNNDKKKHEFSRDGLKRPRKGLLDDIPES